MCVLSLLLFRGTSVFLSMPIQCMLLHTHTHTLHKNITIRASASLFICCFILFVYLNFFHFYLLFFVFRFCFRSACVAIHINGYCSLASLCARYEFDFISFHLVQLHALIKCVRVCECVCVCMYEFYTCADKVLCSSFLRIYAAALLLTRWLNK